MTISSSVRVAGPYTGTGSVSIYPFAFKVFQASDVLVKQTDLSGNVTTLALTTDYSVTLSSDQNANPGGSIDLNTPLPNGYQLVISSQVQELQGTSLTNNGGFYPNVIENALDYLTVLVQQAQTEINASLQIPLGGSEYDAGGRRIVNGADAVGATDFTTQQQVDQKVAAAAGGLAPTDVALYSKFASTAIGAGAYLSAFQQNWSGAAARTVQARLSDTVYLTDFTGVDPTGVSDSTAAINACITHCQTYGKRMHVPAGTYLTDTINYGHPAGSLSDITITGDGANCTTFVKKSSDSTPLFSAGTTAGYTGGGRIEGITFKGISGNTTACLDLTACDHWTFYDCLFTDALIGVNELGGVSNRYIACEWEYNNTGVYLDTAPSPSTSVSANNITFLGCIFGNAADVAVHAETASQISLLNCDLEANGLGGGIGSSAVYTGTSIGSIGVHIKNCWIENNGTTAPVYFTTGNNTIEDTLFIANAAATYDLYVSGGTYTLKNVVFATSKASNVYETSGVGSGNLWINCTVPGKTVDLTKTSIITGTSITMRSYEVPVVQGKTSPLIQTGQVTCNSSGVATVTFPKAFGAAPVVNATIIGSNAAVVPGVQISGVTTTGFTIQTTYWSGTAIGTSAVSVDWIAIGQGT